MDHNLDIGKYSLTELLQLFDLDGNRITENELRKAKRKVLMLHPDKSGLDSSYFLFYKKAFDLILGMYKETIMVTAPVENVDYIAENIKDTNYQKSFNNVISKMDKNEFHGKFNELFETHMSKKIDKTKNEWFTSEESIFSLPNEKISQGQMNNEINKIKKIQNENRIINFREVNPTIINNGSNLYDEENNDEDYISSNIFSKLKYDDLRKVHKDETVFSVQETDINNIKMYRNAEEYKKSRSVIEPLEKNASQKMLEEKEKFLFDKMKQKEYESQLQYMEYQKRNKTIMSSFLYIQ
jgi:hypothetical protein